MTADIYNAAAYLIDRNIDAGRADKTAFIDPAKQLTYGELQANSNRMANLLGELGICRETRIAVLMLDTVDWPVVFLGAIRAGVVPVALNTLLTASQYRYMLEDSRSEALFVSAALLPVVEPILGEIDGLKHVVVTGGEAGPHQAFDVLLGRQSESFAGVDTHPDEDAFWLYSSGSTGAPKGVRHVHTSLQVTAETYASQILHMQERDIVFSAAKFFFAYGLGNALTFPMSVGATAVLWPGRPTPESVFDIMHQHQPTVFFGVPTLYAAILADDECSREKGSKNLRLCVSAGEALPEDVGKSWRNSFGVDIYDGIGSTEMLHIFLSNSAADLRYGTTGKAVPGYQARLVDEDGNEVDDGEIGELLIAGDSMAAGYWNKRDKTRSTFEGKWARTGDKYIRTKEGFFQYCGRTDDMFKVSGIWVSPFEVEQALVSHEAVLEAAVVAHADSDELVKPRAFVVLKQGQAGDGLFETLKDHVKAEIGAWKYPRWIDFVEELPKTATGKIQRFKLRDMS